MRTVQLSDGRLRQFGGRARSASPGALRPQSEFAARVRFSNQHKPFPAPDKECAERGGSLSLEQQLQEVREALAAAEASHAEEKDELLIRCQEADIALSTAGRLQGQLRMELGIRQNLLAQERHRREVELAAARQEVAAAQRLLGGLQDKIDQLSLAVLSCPGPSEVHSQGPAPGADSDDESEGPWDTPGAVCPALLRALEAMEKECKIELPAAECRVPTPPLPAPRPAPAAGHHYDAQGATNTEEAGDAKQWGAASRLAAAVLAEEEEWGLPGPTAPSPFQGTSVLAVVAEMLNDTSAPKALTAQRPCSALRPSSSLAGVTPPSANPTRRVEDEGGTPPGADGCGAERVGFHPIPWAGAWWLPCARAAAGAVSAAAAAAAAEIQVCIYCIIVLVMVTAVLLMGMSFSSAAVVPRSVGTGKVLHITWKDRSSA